MAGLVSPARFPVAGISLPLSGPTAGRSDDVVTLPVGREKLKFGSPVSIGSVFVRSSDLNGWQTMQLKHLNLTTSDVTSLAAFFERFFGFKRCLELGSGALALMRNNEDFVLTLMKPKKHDPVAYPETFHVGFYVDDVAAVQAKRDELTAAGLSPGDIRDAGRSGRGTHFYCTAPGHVVVEVATPPTLHEADIP